MIYNLDDLIFDTIYSSWTLFLMIFKFLLDDFYTLYLITISITELSAG